MKEELILFIAPEHWTLSVLSVLTIGITTFLVLLFGFFYYKTFSDSKRFDLKDQVGVGIKLVDGD